MASCEGFEPSTFRFVAGCSSPIELTGHWCFLRESNPSVHRLKAYCHTAWLRKHLTGTPGEIRTLDPAIKSRVLLASWATGAFLVLPIGLEPTSHWLRVSYSTIELQKQYEKHVFVLTFVFAYTWISCFSFFSP